MFTFDQITQLNKERLAVPHLAIDLIYKVDEVITTAKDAGYFLLVVAGWRSLAEQNALYAQGRTAPGRIVTHAKGMESKHCQGKAVDLAFVVNGQISWDWSLYNKLGAWAKEAGLIWGGDFKNIKDGDHVEVK